MPQAARASAHSDTAQRAERRAERQADKPARKPEKRELQDMLDKRDMKEARRLRFLERFRDVPARSSRRRRW
ncbi:hypothetical protein D3C72_1932600 [compost metagenome]